jgi:hypothetical protein
MKKALLLLIIATLFFTTHAYCQDKATRFCQIDFSLRGRKHKIKIDYGAKDGYSPFKDTVENRQLEGIGEMTTIVEVLNTMDLLGWSLIDTIANEEGAPPSTTFYTFIFKKAFLKSDLSIPKTTSSK